MQAPTPAPFDDAKRTAWAYGGPVTPGQVVRREVFKTPDFVRLYFQNGVVLNFKHTDFSKNSVVAHILFGSGQQEVPPASSFDAAISAHLVYAGALKRNDLDDIARVCENRLCNAELQVGRDSFELQASTRPDDLLVELQILSGLLTEPGFRSTMTASLPTLASSFYRQMNINLGLLANRQLEDALPLPHVQDLPSEAHIAGLKAEEIACLLAPALTRDTIEVTLVGDIDEKAAVLSMGRTLGALPPLAGLTIPFAPTPPT